MSFTILRRSLAAPRVLVRAEELAANGCAGSRLPEVRPGGLTPALAEAAAAACPTGALALAGTAGAAYLALDYARCTGCGGCEESAPEAFQPMARAGICGLTRPALVRRWRLEDGQEVAPADPTAAALGEAIRRRLGRALNIRQLDAGSCNGCEAEITALTNPYYDLERFNLHFVASPKHADLLLVTGPVTRNMEEAVRATYAATPAPKLVVAVGACGCGGGIFAGSPAVVGPVDAVIPVDTYVPGCPPTPAMLLSGILRTLGLAAAKVEGAGAGGQPLARSAHLSQ